MLRVLLDEFVVTFDRYADSFQLKIWTATREAGGGGPVRVGDDEVDPEQGAVSESQRTKGQGVSFPHVKGIDHAGNPDFLIMLMDTVIGMCGLDIVMRRRSSW